MLFSSCVRTMTGKAAFSRSTAFCTITGRRRSLGLNGRLEIGEPRNIDTDGYHLAGRRWLILRSRWPADLPRCGCGLASTAAGGALEPLPLAFLVLQSVLALAFPEPLIASPLCRPVARKITCIVSQPLVRSGLIESLRFVISRRPTRRTSWGLHRPR
jgi:hypothetical protein